MATTPLLARKGRASYLGERSIGHQDPGATSAALLIAGLAEASGTSEAGEASGTAPCVLNAADEVAVAAFMDGRIPFTAIAEVVGETLAAMPASVPSHFDDLFAADAEARERAESLCRAPV